LRENDDIRKWKEDLAERERRVHDLEKKMEEWERVREETAVQRKRLSNTVSEVETSRKSLEAEVNCIPASPTHSTMTITPEVRISDSSTHELLALRETHQRTLAELNSVSTKYHEALKEISDLAAQISEAKLHSETSSEISSPADTSTLGGRVLRNSPSPRHRTLSRRESLSAISVPPSPNMSPSARRNFFRHAASSEGLHSRSQSQSLSSELYSVPFSRTPWVASPGDSLLSPISASFPTVPPKSLHRGISQDNFRSAESLEKEIQSLQSVSLFKLTMSFCLPWQSFSMSRSLGPQRP
jgi:kinesin family protein 4/21/27